MASYKYPGVYIEEVASGVRPIESASTSTAVFIGTTTKGSADDPPKLISKWSEYQGDNQFGDIMGAGGAPNAMGLAAYTFFLNGGGAAYICHVGTDADAEAYKKVFASLEKIRDINIICLPGKTYDDDKDIFDQAIAHAENVMKNRMVIVDVGENTELDKNTSSTSLDLPSSPFSVAYYPWLEVNNPNYKKDAETGVETGGEKTFKVAPSSFAAGMWAKIDGRRGVWKAPAGVETSLLGVAGLADNVDDAQQGVLNPLGVNCIRRVPGAGPVIWGARTLATQKSHDWRYVPVRRTAIMIEESIYNNIQWAVFEPNDHRLWSSLRVNIDAFMNGLWRAGAFQGEKASDAYFVRCNLDDTMTQTDIDLGRVIVDVGFAPVKPAEFVIIRIQQKVAQQ